MLALTSCMLLYAAPASAQTALCEASRWLVQESDQQVMERIVAISTFPVVLDPRLWDGDELKPEVRRKTIELVEHLFDNLRLSPEVVISDIELFGSNASYEYDDVADYGVHVFLKSSDPTKLDPILISKMLRIYNLYIEARQEGKILFNGIVVEVTFHLDPRSKGYKPRPGVGQYSISSGKWIVEPVAQPNNFDRSEMLSDARRWIDKWNSLVCQYEEAASDFDCSRFNALDLEMSKYRSAGFEKGLGSRSTENLTYRLLRRLSVNIPDAVDVAEDECAAQKFSVAEPMQ